MGLKHKVYINVAQPNGNSYPIIKSGKIEIRKRLLNYLFGEKANILVITPGDSVETVEIREIKGGNIHG